MIATTKKLIEEVEEMLNNLPGVTSVHGRFYDLSSKYYRFVGNHALYSKDVLRYLGCIDLKDLSETEKQERAFHWGSRDCSARECIILENSNTDKQWLIETLCGFNSGNVIKFKSLKSAWGQQPDLAAYEVKLMQKIQLLCVMEMTFTRPINNRQLSFQEIARRAQIPVSEVISDNTSNIANSMHV
ncbi:hypothetical protein AMELA_G00133220 [Ameiurus melas]|uniref:26S proteasome non-ATPase regulatory subunit 13 n=1 Tax=Ameiurus melas TaxID=219545 RepID=A0A7J6ALT7_AMEME|nr:hypothetical protein AMELA_G00133220 [Ameiurus melas]